MRDNDANDDDRNSACWAKSVEITDHILVGTNTNIGAFVVYTVRVETMNVSDCFNPVRRECKPGAACECLRQLVLHHTN